MKINPINGVHKNGKAIKLIEYIKLLPLCNLPTLQATSGGFDFNIRRAICIKYYL